MLEKTDQISRHSAASPNRGHVSAVHQPEVGDRKTITLGTHRICAPQDTLDRVSPLLPRFGITRVAEVTRLDDIGIPVFQAIRPASRTISLSQGKGISAELARVSCIMESIEAWHAENPALTSTRETVGHMKSQILYSLHDLNLVDNQLLHDDLVLEWFPAQHLGSQDFTFVPADYVQLDFTPTSRWVLPAFFTSTNGLASGNSLEEASLHGLYELVERDAATRLAKGELSAQLVDLESVDGQASRVVLERLQRANVAVDVFFIESPTDIPCFSAHIISHSFPVVVGGYGCHLDRDTALSRALTEAIQARLTLISAAREDLDPRIYRRICGFGPLPKRELDLRSDQPPLDFREIPTMCFERVSEDLLEVTNRIMSAVGSSPMVVDLTRRNYAIPVVFVICPKLLYNEHAA